jgi:hypothetical protein
MLTALRRHFSPSYALRQDFEALTFPPIEPCLPYACEDSRGCFANDPRAIQVHACGYPQDQDLEVIEDIDRLLVEVVTVTESVEVFDLREITGCTQAGGSSGERTLAEWGKNLLREPVDFGRRTDPEEQLAWYLHQCLGGTALTLERASWMGKTLYLSNASGTTELALAVALAVRHEIAFPLSGTVRTRTANADVANELCSSYGAWICEVPTANRIKSLLLKHGVDVYWSFIGRMVSHAHLQVVLYVPLEQPLGEEVSNRMTRLLHERQCFTMWTWLDHFKRL